MAQRIRLQIKKVQGDLVKGIERIIGEGAFASFSAIVLASPVDTGHFRNNWQVGINERKLGILEGVDKSGGPTIQKNESVFANYEMGKGQGNKIIFSNNVAYALRLNQGHSGQAASGFVQKALRAGIKALGVSGKIFKS
jgi:hypothetical protein